MPAFFLRANSMTVTRKVLFSLVFAVAVGLLIVGLGAGYGNKTPDAGDQNATQPETKTAAKDQASKSTAEKAVKQEPAKETSAPKILTMAEAVIIAEKFGKGYTLKAERIERPTLSYSFEIQSIDGTKKLIDLTAEGQLKPLSKTVMNKTGKKRPGQ